MSQEEAQMTETAADLGYRSYNHLERWGHPDVEGIALGLVHVFPKLDGSNGVVWHDGAELRCGTRRRELKRGDTSDNQGFGAWVFAHEDQWASVLGSRPFWVVYGEWLVPHTFKAYRDDAWRRFWVFDVYDRERGRYLAFDEYAPPLQAAGLDLIEPLCTIDNPSEDQIRARVEMNTYLVRDGAGVGEGIVVKNYLWTNIYGRQPWAKVVRNAFKEENRRKFGTTHIHGEFQVEAAIAEEFCTPHLVGKTRAKVVADVAESNGIDLASSPNAQQEIEQRHRGRVIPQLLSRVYHDLVVEEAWAAIKKHKNPTIDFKKLQSHVYQRVKQYASDLF